MRVILGLPVVFAFALLLVGQLSEEALITAALLTACTLAWRRLLRAASRRHIAAPGHGHLAAWGRAILALPGDTARIGVALGRAIAGGGSSWRAVEAPFHFGGRDDPRDAGRRAAAVAAGSLTPDRIVVDLGPGSAGAATHRLANGSDGSPEWLT